MSICPASNKVVCHCARTAFLLHLCLWWPALQAQNQEEAARVAIGHAVLERYGIPASLLSLGALDFGIIVDGTLVMVEHIVHHMQERAHAKSRATVYETILNAALEVESPIFFSLLIIISAYIPLFTLERVERRFAARTSLAAVRGAGVDVTPVGPFRVGAHSFQLAVPRF